MECANDAQNCGDREHPLVTARLRDLGGLIQEAVEIFA
jgi:hypothetical protein